MNDRALRHTIIGLGGKANGIPGEDGFQITVASEVMAILCLAADLHDLKKRLGDILVAYTYAGEPVYCRDLKAEGAMAALLKDAIKPNLIQTLENTPALMHGGPFANIAHGCNSVRATKLALKLADYCITEAGFGSDLGAEKFLDIKCRMAGLTPSAVVLVATVRALKYNGGVAKADLSAGECGGAEKGPAPTWKSISKTCRSSACRSWLPSTGSAPIPMPKSQSSPRPCEKNGVAFSPVRTLCQGRRRRPWTWQRRSWLPVRSPRTSTPSMSWICPVEEKIETICREIYGADRCGILRCRKEGRSRTSTALGKGGLPICMAKTQYSLSDNPKLLGRPEGFTIHVGEVRLSAGAGFIVVQTGDIMTMPGLPKVPAANQIDVDEDGQILGLF